MWQCRWFVFLLPVASLRAVNRENRLTCNTITTALHLVDPQLKNESTHKGYHLQDSSNSQRLYALGERPDTVHWLQDSTNVGVGPEQLLVWFVQTARPELSNRLPTENSQQAVDTDRPIERLLSLRYRRRPIDYAFLDRTDVYDLKREIRLEEHLVALHRLEMFGGPAAERLANWFPSS